MLRHRRSRLSGQPLASRTRMPMVSFRIVRLWCAVLTLLAAPAAAQNGLSQNYLPQNHMPDAFIYLRDVAPGIEQDMRYASTDNFTGHPLPGYSAPECVLRREVAEALKAAEADLANSGLALKVYDCYRPTRAVRAMMRWAADGNEGRATKRFFPTLDKRTLFASGYIATRSAHSTGTAVDLTLVKRPAKSAAPFDPATAYGSCIGPATERAPDNSIDMGTGFDCFDVKSHTTNASISPNARHWRGVFVATMRQHGFKNYFREWWHFSYGPPPSQVYDFPILSRGN
jgi:zinc D-Ala-D-Ala dipeptidase